MKFTLGKQRKQEQTQARIDEITKDKLYLYFRENEAIRARFAKRINESFKRQLTNERD